jgi:hypothetical protein
MAYTNPAEHHPMLSQLNHSWERSQPGQQALKHGKMCMRHSRHSMILNQTTFSTVAIGVCTCDTSLLRPAGSDQCWNIKHMQMMMHVISIMPVPENKPKPC